MSELQLHSLHGNLLFSVEKINESNSGNNKKDLKYNTINLLVFFTNSGAMNPTNICDNAVVMAAPVIPK